METSTVISTVILISMQESTVTGINYLIQQIKLIQEKQSKAFQQANCVVKDVNFHLNNNFFGYKTLNFKELN